MDADLKKDIIMEHYENPMNKGLVDDKDYHKINMNSETCIDNLDFMVKIVDNKIKDVRYDGEACAISTSASSIMSSLMIGKTVDEALNIINNYEAMIDEKPYDASILKEAVVYDEIGKQANRKKCALLPFTGIK